MPHDFFLSYACQDNEQAMPGDPESKWVTNFHDALVGKLAFYLRRKPDVFFDRSDLSGNTALTPKIKAALEDSHLFVAVSSPTYYERPWCKLERAGFIARLQPNPAVEERVFVVHMDDVDSLIKPRTWQSEFFSDVKGYCFYRPDKDGRRHTLGSPSLKLPIGDANSYFVEIDRLALDMFQRITKIQASGVSQAQTAAPAAVAGEHVFLAENAFRSNADREELRRALRDAGFEARPAASLAIKSREELAAAMSGALAFIQIVSPVLVPCAPGISSTYDQLQLESAREAELETFRWRAPDLDLEEGAKNFPAYKEFADAPDVQKGLLQAFKADLITALTDLRARRRVKQAVQGDEPLVVIAGEPDDISAHMTLVGRQLEDRAVGYLVTNDPISELQGEDVRGFLVLYGESRPESVCERLKVVRKIPKTRLPHLRVGIYFCAGERPLYFNWKLMKIFSNNADSIDAFAQAVAH